jgi:hypothetical protein
VGDGGNMILWNIDILPQSLQGVTTKNTTIWIFIAMKISNISSLFLRTYEIRITSSFDLRSWYFYGD